MVTAKSDSKSSIDDLVGKSQAKPKTAAKAPVKAKPVLKPVPKSTSTTVKPVSRTTSSPSPARPMTRTVSPPTRPVVDMTPRQPSEAPPPMYSSHTGRRRFDGVVEGRRLPDADVPTEKVKGFLDIGGNNHGILRPHFISSPDDIYISNSQIRRFQIRPGDLVSGPARRPKENERFWGLLKVEKINDLPIDKVGQRPNFDRLTPIYPKERLILETGKEPLASRIIDLVSPIGKGQRGLIVSPPKAGKTTIIKQIATGVSKNYPDIHLMAVLVGERPEEVTDIARSVKGEVVASNFDESPEKQTTIAEIALERAKRLVEIGKDVLILLDSVTRLARAYNLSIPTSGRTLSGGFDPAALYPPKKFFGAARCFEEGGSLTILGTALIETGSKMDDLVYEEFKGTGNLELHLTRALEQRRIFPAIDVLKSGTRQEQLLFSKSDYERIVTMRRMLDMLGKNERTELLIERLRKTKSNKEFLASLKEG